MKKNDFQELVDRSLSKLTWDERQRHRVLCAVKEEKSMKKKLSTTLILAAVLLCLSAAALAAGWTFSPRGAAGRTADRAMEAQYGVTADLLSLFHREIHLNEDGTAAVVYSALSPMLEGELARRIGSYTVQVNGGEAFASWSNDGKDTSGGLEAEAFGAEQLWQLSRDYDSAMQQLRQSGVVEPTVSAMVTPEPAPDAAAQEEQKRLDGLAKAEAMGSVALAQAAEIARQAICDEYALDEEQRTALLYEPDSAYAILEEDRPLVELLFWLWPQEDGSFAEKNGQYWVRIDLTGGVIEEILYDACLLGNG